jgi:hypothetical protein
MGFHIKLYNILKITVIRTKNFCAPSICGVGIRSVSAAKFMMVQAYRIAGIIKEMFFGFVMNEIMNGLY